MTASGPAGGSVQADRGPLLAAAPWMAAAVAFMVLYWRPMSDTATIWWTDPDAGHGMLLVPVAIFLAWRAGRPEGTRPQPWLGSIVLVLAVALRYLSGLAAELFTMRLSIVVALVGLVIFARGARQVRHWWLPAVLFVLSMPLPEVLVGSLALPLQFRASQMGAALLDWRHVPVLLDGNVIRLSGGTTLFVTEACSGLRSLSALLALGFLIGGVWLKTVWGRALLVLAAIPVAMVLNSVRIFLTGFTVQFIDPALGQGLMHYTEGWAMFMAAFMVLAATTWLLAHSELAMAHRKVTR